MVIEKILKLFDIKDKNDVEKECVSENGEILNELKAAREDWLQSLRDFENARDIEIIDNCTYRIKACQSRYEYFLREAKNRGLTLLKNDEIHHVTGNADNKYACRVYHKLFDGKNSKTDSLYE